MADLLRTHAEAFALALEVGAASVSEVVAWADSMIAAQEHPHWSLCELSLCRNEYPPDVIPLLRQVPGTPELGAARVQVTRMLLTSLTEHPSRADHIAQALYQLALAQAIDDPALREVAWWAWDALDLAGTGAIAETRSEVLQRMQGALTRVVQRR